VAGAAVREVSGLSSRSRCHVLLYDVVKCGLEFTAACRPAAIANKVTGCMLYFSPGGGLNAGFCAAGGTVRWQRMLLLAAGSPWAVPKASTAFTASSDGSSDSSSSSSSGGDGRKQGTGSRRKQRSSSKMSAAATGRPDMPVVTLKAAAELPDGAFPYAPSHDMGPLPLDLPDHVLWKLLGSSSSALYEEMQRLSDVWLQLAAAAAQDPHWKAQLQNIGRDLPAAMTRVRWRNLRKSQVSLIQQHGAAPSSSSSSWWGDDCMQSRDWQQQPAAAAAAALRHRFWQHLLQPRELQQLLLRLTFLLQSEFRQQMPGGSAAAAAAAAAATTHAAARVPAAAAAAVNAVAVPERDSSALSSLLVQSDEAFAADHPQFTTWLHLQLVVGGQAALEGGAAAAERAAAAALAAPGCCCHGPYLLPGG